jgi:2-polyprenyl-6-methoxyphenol hydroxylase-like FAD-dependent oxidoreductase
MTRPFDICIRGAGIVGHTLALHLASKQLRVALTAPGINNPVASASTDVRAYALNPASRALLEAVRCWPDAVDATPVLAMQVHGDDGGQVDFAATTLGADALNWIVDVPALEARLAEAVRFQPLIELFGTPQSATLTVVCEGKASHSRQEWGVEWDVTPYNQWALAARVQCETPHGQVARQWFSQGEILAFLPLGGADGSQCAIVWSVSPERAHALVDEPDETFGAALTAASHNQLGAISLASPRGIWPLQQALARRWCGVAEAGTWVLAGDAAHTVHPLAGQGLNLGLGDVAELVRVLGDRPYWRSVNDMRLLRPYERARKAEFALIGNTGDAIQQLFANPHPAAQALRNWGMNQFERSRSIKHWVTQRAMGAMDTASSRTPPRKPHP